MSSVARSPVFRIVRLGRIAARGVQILPPLLQRARKCRPFVCHLGGGRQTLAPSWHRFTLQKVLTLALSWRLEAAVRVGVVPAPDSTAQVGAPCAVPPAWCRNKKGRELGPGTSNVEAEPQFDKPGVTGSSPLPSRCSFTEGGIDPRLVYRPRAVRWLGHPASSLEELNPLDYQHDTEHPMLVLCVPGKGRASISGRARLLGRRQRGADCRRSRQGRGAGTRRPGVGLDERARRGPSKPLPLTALIHPGVWGRIWRRGLR